MRVGVVTEGPSDYLVLKSLLGHVAPDIVPEHVWPDTQVGGRPYGWRGVRSWCEDHRDRLEPLMRGVVGRELDALVIHVDCSMAHNVGARHPCPPSHDTADALRFVVHATWLARPQRPAWLVIATPAQTTDAWVVAALDPPYAGLDGIECDADAERELVRRKLLRSKDGEVRKPLKRYAPLTRAVALNWERVAQTCPQAARFALDSAAAATAVAHGCWYVA